MSSNINKKFRLPFSSNKSLILNYISICSYHKQSEPSLTANFTTLNETSAKRYFIGDKLDVNWVVQHTYNTSYEDAKNVRISFYSNTLKLLQGTYDKPGHSGQSLTIRDAFHSGEIVVSNLTQGM